MSIDPGIKNFCFCIENYSPFGNQSVLALENSCLANCGKRLTEEVLDKMTNIIKTQFSKFTISHVLIERQPPKSYNNIRIMQHLWTLIHSLWPETQLELYSAFLKTSVYGQHFDKYSERKKWAVKYAKELMTNRIQSEEAQYLDGNNIIALEKLNVRKADDMADCILMINSWYKIKHKKLF